MKSNCGNWSTGPVVFLVIAVALSLVSECVGGEPSAPSIAVPPKRGHNATTMPRKQSTAGDYLSPHTDKTVPSPSGAVPAKQIQNTNTVPRKVAIVGDLSSSHSEKAATGSGTAVLTKEKQKATTQPQKAKMAADSLDNHTEKAAPSQSQTGLFPVSIIHVNDFHARYVHFIEHI